MKEIYRPFLAHIYFQITLISNILSPKAHTVSHGPVTNASIDNVDTIYKAAALLATNACNAL